MYIYIYIQFRMSTSADVSVALAQKLRENVEKPCIVCKVVVKRGLACSVCGTVTHRSCALKVKKCCGVNFNLVDEMQVDSAHDSRSDLFRMVESILTEVKTNNFLLKENMMLKDKVITL